MAPGDFFAPAIERQQMGGVIVGITSD